MGHNSYLKIDFLPVYLFFFKFYFIFKLYITVLPFDLAKLTLALCETLNKKVKSFLGSKNCEVYVLFFKLAFRGS